MRQTIKDFVSIVAETLPIHEPVYEFGSLQVEDQEGFKSLLADFSGAFVGWAGRERHPHTVVGVGFKGGGRRPRKNARAYPGSGRPDLGG
ncbi:MAG: hypothetical protein JRI97_09100 [Deltaproteobacteria bacterium]|nr:hypothetical protein [Deltaproteobacteria bacterium]